MEEIINEDYKLTPEQLQSVREAITSGWRVVCLTVPAMHSFTIRFYKNPNQLSSTTLQPLNLKFISINLLKVLTSLPTSLLPNLENLTMPTGPFPDLKSITIESSPFINPTEFTLSCFVEKQVRLQPFIFAVAELEDDCKLYLQSNYTRMPATPAEVRFAQISGVLQYFDAQGQLHEFLRFNRSYEPNLAIRYAPGVIYNLTNLQPLELLE